ncbi:hypothetical protein C8R45DRAFT_945042 [Mycena sanguinolenta]|nr:hypothetical protein C8R45DRAFT_945042 [Mycena sanguinolenta]
MCAIWCVALGLPWAPAYVEAFDESTVQAAFKALQEIQRDRGAKEAGKEAKKAERPRRKEAREEIEKEWAEMKRNHGMLVAVWEEECNRLMKLGTKKKDLPSKPKLGKKQQLPTTEEEEDNLEDELADEIDV